MNDELRKKVGERSRKCEEGHLTIDLDDNGKVKAMRGYGKAKDFQKKKNE